MGQRREREVVRKGFWRPMFAALKCLRESGEGEGKKQVLLLLGAGLCIRSHSPQDGHSRSDDFSGLWCIQNRQQSCACNALSTPRITSLILYLQPEPILTFCHRRRILNWQNVCLHAELTEN